MEGLTPTIPSPHPSGRDIHQNNYARIPLDLTFIRNVMNDANWKSSELRNWYNGEGTEIKNVFNVACID